MLELAGMKFSYVSGPIGMCLLTPSETLIKNLKKGYDAIPICGFEDIHWNINKNCYELNMCKDKTTDCVTLYTPLLYRLLDQLATKEYPINLFMEIGFFPYLLSNNKLISHERLSIFNANDGSMTYIARRHAACLSTSRSTDNDLCFTSNLKYHLSDIRYQPNHLQLSNEEMKMIGVANQLVKESPYMTVPLQDLYRIAQDIVNHDKPFKYETYSTHFPTFESYMLDAFKKCCQRSEAKFYDMKAIELLMLAITDANAFVNRVIRFPQWMSRSVFADRMSKSIFPFTFLVTMWKQYMRYAFIRRSTDETYIANLEVLHTLDDTVFDIYYHPTFDRLRTRPARERLSDRSLEVDDHEFNVAKAKMKSLYNARAYFSEILDDAMMEFYFLITSWKTEHNNSLLSVFSAGATHVENVRFFMQKHGYYNTKCINSINKTRCISFHKNELSISKRLLSYWTKVNSKKQYELYQRMALQTRRVELLGPEIVYKILNGNAVPESEVNEKIKDINNITTLDLVSINVPSQYVNKQLTL